MNRILLIPLAAVGFLVSQALAEDCKEGGKQAFCDWGTSCWNINTTYGDVPDVCAAGSCTCTQLIASCVKDGSLYTDVTSEGAGITCNGNWAGKGKDPGREFLGYCDWGPCSCKGEHSCEEGGGCFEIENRDNLSECENYATVFSSESQCPTASLPRSRGGSCSSNPIRPDKLETSQFGLTVIPQAGSLLISSLREATVSLFDMRGQQVFSQEVAAGYSTLRLNGQKQGVYYAVVSSGSSKQTVKVVLK